jgi:hypothetical protein
LKKILQNSPQGYQKKRNFALISKMCRLLEFSKREKNVTENGFFRHLENQRKIPFLLLPSAPNLEEIFFKRGGAELTWSWTAVLVMRGWAMM